MGLSKSFSTLFLITDSNCLFKTSIRFSTALRGFNLSIKRFLSALSFSISTVVAFFGPLGLRGSIPALKSSISLDSFSNCLRRRSCSGELLLNLLNKESLSSRIFFKASLAFFI